MKRVLILGRGGAGKSTLARSIQEITKLPVIELDKIFWRTGLAATPRSEWIQIQRSLADGDDWIMDGDLGPSDVLEPRLERADTVVLLDFSLVRCAWNALRRSSERADFWSWLMAYRRKSLPAIKQAITDHAPRSTLYIFHNPRAVGLFLNSLRKGR